MTTPSQPDLTPLALQELPPIRTTGNGRQPPATTERPSTPRRTWSPSTSSTPCRPKISRSRTSTGRPRSRRSAGRGVRRTSGPIRRGPGPAGCCASRTPATTTCSRSRSSIPTRAVYRVHLLVTRKGTAKLWPVRMPVNGDDFPSARQQRAILADAAAMWVSCQWKGGKRGRWLWRRFPDLTDVPRWPEELDAPARATRLRRRHDRRTRRIRGFSPSRGRRLGPHAGVGGGLRVRGRARAALSGGAGPRPHPCSPRVGGRALDARGRAVPGRAGQHHDRLSRLGGDLVLPRAGVGAAGPRRGPVRGVSRCS